MLRDAEVLEGLLQGTSLVDCGSQRAFSYWFFLKNRFLVKNFTDTKMLESYNHGHILELCNVLEKTLDLSQVMWCLISIVKVIEHTFAQ